MISAIILDSDQKEQLKIEKDLKNLIAYHTDEFLEIHYFSEYKSFITYLETAELLDLAVIDVVLSDGLRAAEKIHKYFPDAEIMLVADLSVSPVKYMCPSIRAASLLLRPANAEWENIIRDFFLLIIEGQNSSSSQDTFKIENKKGILRIPFQQIYYLEAREKKVFIRTGIEELGVSGTLEKLLEQLPPNFRRCHRSFIVNEDQIVQVNFSENLLHLKNELIVPVSRSYRKDFKKESL